MSTKRFLFIYFIFVEASAIIIRNDVSVTLYQNLAQESQFSACGVINDMGGEYCTATLINPRTILTVAHCLVTNDSCVQPACTPIDPTTLQFGFGISANSLTDVATFSSCIPNQIYNGSDTMGANDIGMASLQRRFPYISVPLLATQSNVGQIGTIIGYGIGGNGSTPPDPSYQTKTAANNVLDGEVIYPGKTAQVVLVADFDCPSGCGSCNCVGTCGGSCNTNTTILELMSSVEPLSLEGASSYGDSGGPIYVYVNEFWQITGLVSQGNSDGDVQYGGIDLYTPVHLFLDWVAANNPLKTAIWRSASGNWSTGGSWTGGASPNNVENPGANLATYYEAVINTPVSVAVDTDFTIDALYLLHPEAFLIVPPSRSPTSYETHLQAGLLEIDGTFSSSFTLMGGTLTGSGTLVAILPNVSQPPAPIPQFSLPPVLNRGGMITPGTLSTIGTLRVTGSFEQTAGTLKIKTATTSDLLAVSGAASLGGHLTVAGLSGFNKEPGTTITVLTADSVSGQFASVSKENLPSLFLSAVYLPSSVQVLLNPTADTYISSIGQTTFASINQTNIRLERQFKKIRGRLSHSSTPHLVVQNDEIKLRKTEQLRDKKQEWEVYLGPFGSFGEIKSRGTQEGIDYWIAGGLVGFDRAFQRGGVGFLASYARIDNKGKNQWGDADVDQIHTSIYGTTVASAIPPLSFNGIVGGSFECYEINRNTGLLIQPALAKGTPYGEEGDLLFGLEYTCSKPMGEIGFAEIVPLGYAQYIYAHIDGYTETGAGSFNLKVAAQTSQSFRTFLGSRFHFLFPREAFWVKTEVDIRWQYEFLDHEGAVHFTPAQVAGISTSTTVYGGARNTLLFGADFLFTHNAGYQVEASYDLEWNGPFNNNSFNFSFSYLF